jgi:branched-chain amino acid transport system ATP-binding protein
MKPLLEAHGVSVRFGGITALSNVTFKLFPRELLGLIGPNGAGKTTLLRCVIGTAAPNEGSILLFGQEISGLTTDARARLGIALTHQIVRPFRSMSVIDNVVFAAGHAKTANVVSALFAVSRATERRRAGELLDLLGIADYRDAAPATLPLGALKRLEVARALAIKPRVLLLDEPLAGLNHLEANRLAATLQDLNAQGITMILIEHNLGQVANVCSRLVVLDNGRKIADGPTRDTLSDPNVVAAYTGKEAVRA